MAEVQQIGDDFIIAKGEFTHAHIEEGWMPIKKGYKMVEDRNPDTGKVKMKKEKSGISIPKAVAMTSNFKPGKTDDDPGTTIFNFYVASNVIEKAIEDGIVVGSCKDPLHPSMIRLNQVLLNEATMAFAEWLDSSGDPSDRRRSATIAPESPVGLAFA